MVVRAGIAVLALIVVTQGSPHAASDPQAPVKLCWIEKSRYYATKTCEPAPFLFGAVVGACADAEAETLRLSLKDPRFKHIPVDKMMELVREMRDVWKPRIEMEIVNTRIEQNSCSVN